MAKKILCRADGNSSTGLGHLYRMFALYEVYKDHFDVTYITREDSTLGVIPEEYNQVVIPKEITIEEEPFWLAQQYNTKHTVVIADGYQFVSNYQKAIKQQGFDLIIVDDLTTEYMYADIVVNHSPHCTPKDFNAEKYTQFALGTDYAMLRPAFNNAAKSTRQIEQIENVFICFGGSDMYNLSLRAAKAMLNIEAVKEIHVVLGGAYEHEEIFELQKACNHLNLYQNLDELTLYELMNSCQLAIAPSSTILYELCSVKMPVLSGFYVENQRNIYKALSHKDIVIGGGDFSEYTSEDFEKHINTILKDKAIAPYLERQQEFFDGKNTVRFLALTNTFNLTFKKADASHLMMVYEWSNDPLVRENSYYSEPIKLDNHKEWYKKKIDDPNTLFLIAYYDEQPAGVIRYELSEDHSVVGILVSNAFRGKRLAASMLSLSARKYFELYQLPILAYIKTTNNASVKAFVNAGYNFHKKTEVNAIESVVYKLIKEDVYR